LPSAARGSRRAGNFSQMVFIGGMLAKTGAIDQRGGRVTEDRTVEKKSKTTTGGNREYQCQTYG